MRFAQGNECTWCWKYGGSSLDHRRSDRPCTQPGSVLKNPRVSYAVQPLDQVASGFGSKFALAIGCIQQRRQTVLLERPGSEDAYGLQIRAATRVFRSVEEDLRPWQAQGISFEQVEAAYCNSPGGGFRLQIIAGRVYIVGEGPGIEDRHRNLKLMLLHLQGLHKLPDVDIGFFFAGEDTGGHRVILPIALHADVNGVVLLRR
ncbi:hypothetical protein WJX74_007530 [Apatococcus lobatus]|uniref:Glycosyl transferase CAP10 domain-containing protein n=1 Tax=Apatococcus lobatus TaxID=904363 RepID=A0AAW1QH07_9CHLO